MQCKSCKTDIADNALICYRCGMPTSEAVHQPVPEVGPSQRRWAPTVLAGVFVLVAVFFLGLTVDGQPVSPVVWLILGAAGVLLAWRLRQ